MRRGREFWEKELGSGWTKKLSPLLKSPYGDKLMNFIETEYALKEVIPPRKFIFRPFRTCPFEELKVVIIGTSPLNSNYPNGMSYGDSFTSAYHSTALCSMVTAIEDEFNHSVPILDFDFTLRKLGEQGILFLNIIPTVPNRIEGAHQKPWNKFMEEVFKVINETSPGTIFMLWGNQAKGLKPFIGKENYILEGDSLLEYSRTKIWKTDSFKEANKILKNNNGIQIDWMAI